MHERLVLPVACLGALGFSFFGDPVLASHPPVPKPSTRGIPVSLTLFGGINLGSPGENFETALRASEMDDDFCPLDDPRETVCVSRSTPRSSKGRLGYCVAFGFLVKPEWEIRALAGGDEDLHTYGVRQVLYRTQLSLDANSVRYAALAAYRPRGGVFRAGMGPAIFNTEIRARDEYTEFPSGIGTRLGVVFDVGASFPRRSHVFADLGVQYWLGGKIQYGLYNVRNGIGNIQVYFPSRHYSLNRARAGIGVGVRL